MSCAESRPVGVNLVGLVVSLLLVGVVSGTVLRHVVQVMPIIMALVLVARRPQWGANAAIPIFAFWAGIVTLIWLFLAGLSSFAQGRYSPGEVVLTAFIAGFSVVGVVASVALGSGAGPARRARLIVGFGLLQLAAMWLSFRPAIANV